MPEQQDQWKGLRRPGDDHQGRTAMQGLGQHQVPFPGVQPM